MPSNHYTDKLKTVALLYLNVAAWSSDFIVAFTMLWAYPVQKLSCYVFRSKSFSKIGQD